MVCLEDILSLSSTFYIFCYTYMTCTLVYHFKIVYLCISDIYRMCPCFACLCLSVHLSLYHCIVNAFHVCWFQDNHIDLTLIFPSDILFILMHIQCMSICLHCCQSVPFNTQILIAIKCQIFKS